MSVQRTPMTRPGYVRLRDELDRLKRVDRHAITKAIAEARAHGDLSENAEYHAAREKQSFIEGRIADLEGKAGNAEGIDPPTSGGGRGWRPGRAAAETPHCEDGGGGLPRVFVRECAGAHGSGHLQMRFFPRRYRAIAFNARGYPPSDVPDDVKAYSQDRAAEDI